MFSGNFNSYKKAVLKFGMWILIVLSLAGICLTVFGVLHTDIKFHEVFHEYWGLICMVTLGIPFVVSILVALVMMLFWFLFVPPSPLLRLVVAGIILFVVAAAIEVFGYYLYEPIQNIVRNIYKMIGII